MNHWNNLADKQQKVQEKYRKKLSKLTKKIEDPYFLCPWCGHKHYISDAKIIKIVAGKDLIDTTYNINTKTETYVKTSYRIRFCAKCYVKNERQKKIFFTIGKIFVIIFCLLILIWAILTEEKLGFYGWVGVFAGIFIIFACAFGCKESIEENFFDTANIEKSFENNAIVRR